MRLNRFFVVTLMSLIVTSVSFSTELKETTLKDLLIESGITTMLKPESPLSTYS
jgi:hypothetical protein